MNDAIRIANCSGFYGDRFSAMREMIEGGPINYLTGDYLAELTMLILWKNKAKGQRGYAKTFLSQLKDCLRLIKSRKIKVVTNAGGLDPEGLYEDILELLKNEQIDLNVGYVRGDDILNKIDEFRKAGETFINLDTGETLESSRYQIVSANVYLGAYPIKKALDEGADIVVTGRATDASLVMGPAWHNFNWDAHDYDKLAGSLVAGHIIECGAQATGGNYSSFHEIKSVRSPGFPIAEIFQDGSFVITKHEGTDGQVSVGTVTSQLLYEIDSSLYLNPDVTARFDTIKLEQVGENRVRGSLIKGEPPPEKLKVCINVFGGYKNTVEFMITGLNTKAKAKLALDSLFDNRDVSKFEEVTTELIETSKTDPETNSEAISRLQVIVKSPDENVVGRSFSAKATELALANYPGFFLSQPPAPANAYGIYWPALISRNLIREEVIVNNKTYTLDEPSHSFKNSDQEAKVYPRKDFSDLKMIRLPFGALVDARSGDKGGNANVGIFVRELDEFYWLEQFLSVEKFKELFADLRDYKIDRYDFENLFALNFVIKGLLDRGVAASSRLDPQAKGLGEYIRARIVDIPEEFIQRRKLNGF